ncbi:MAG: hypothetical protein COC05_04425 [Gammaproteobacteria bacterium]|nr:MAG: hypothetical protein COC05_04425 [Gammaproteobacteria bacterium]
MIFMGRYFAIAIMCLSLSACASLLIGNQLQSKLMWSLLRPLVGFDPNDVNLFEVPLVKNRMTTMLGDQYEPTIKLLKTARKIQQEGVLFYVASRYIPIPKQAKKVTDKAAMIWNADTNQMAVMLIKDGVPKLFSEQIKDTKTALIPTLPKELQTAYNEAQTAYIATKNTQQKLENSRKRIENSIENAPETLIRNTNNKYNKTK